MSSVTLKDWLKANKLEKKLTLDQLEEAGIEEYDDLIALELADVDAVIEDLGITKTAVLRKVKKAMINLLSSKDNEGNADMVTHQNTEDIVTPGTVQQKLPNTINPELQNWLDANGLTGVSASDLTNNLSIMHLSDFNALQTDEEIAEVVSLLNLPPIMRIKFKNAIKKLNAANSSIDNECEEEEEKKEGESVEDDEDAMKKARKIVPKKPVGVVQFKSPKFDVSKPNKTILVIGQTGAGKTTTLNSMLNYLLEVELEDKYRWRLIDETAIKKKKKKCESVTDDVTAYYINPTNPNVPYTLNVVDTPGFGDTRGMGHDEIIVGQIEKFFKEEMDHIDAVCFVIKGNVTRLGSDEKYVMNQVLGIFGNDIGDNIFIMLTFCDNANPPAVEAVKEAQIPHKKIIKFNNSGFFLPDDPDDEPDEFATMYWKLGLVGFKKFFENELPVVETKTLSLTKQVLDERRKLENTIKNLTPTIDEGLDKLQSIRYQLGIVEANEKALNDPNGCKNFTMQVPHYDWYKQPITGSHYTTICNGCQFTCHENCSIAPHEKQHCCAMGSGGYCTECPQKCHYTKHTNESYVWKRKKTFETKRVDDLYKQYVDTQSKKSASEQMIEGMVLDLSSIEYKVSENIKRVRACITRLGEIALRPNAMTEDDYINKLMDTELKLRKQGWEERVDALKSLKKRNEVLQSVQNGDYNPRSLWQQKYGDVLQKTAVYQKKVAKKNGRNKGGIGGFLSSAKNFFTT